MSAKFTIALVVLAGSALSATSWARCDATACAFPAADYLAAHNQLRARHCVPPMVWDAELAAQAKAWANRCMFEHDPSAGSVGENLYYESPRLRDVKAGVDDWYSEIAEYNFATTRYISAAGHFTQVIWKSSTRLGCAVNYCPGMKGAYLVCRYAPAGNVTSNGVWGGKDNVPKPCR